MQFEVKGQTYYLGMLPPEGELVLVVPTQRGLMRLPIVDDGGAPAAQVSERAKSMIH